MEKVIIILGIVLVLVIGGLIFMNKQPINNITDIGKNTINGILKYVITLSGLSNYASTNTNVTQENLFTHLNLTDGSLVLYLPFDVQQDSANKTYDYSNNSNDGAVVNGATFNSTGGVYGGDYQFNGVNNSINISSLNWTPTTFTIGWWMYPLNCLNYNQRIDSGTNWGGFVFHTTSNCEVYVGTDGSTRFTPTQLPANTVGINQWQYFTYTYDGSNGRFYKNGTLLAGPTAQNTPLKWVGLIISELDGGFGGPINGSIDEVMVFNRTLSAIEIKQIYNTTYPRFYPVGQMNFTANNFGTNNTLNITIPNCQQYNGSLINFKVNGGSYSQLNSSCMFNNYNMTGDLTSASVVLQLNSTNNYFYSPVINGNITLNSWLVSAGGSDTTPPTITFDIPPTPANTSSTSSPVTISANISDASNTSSWIDFDKSLVGYWAMDYYNSTGVFDNSTYNNFGTFQNGLNYFNLTTGARGLGLSFDGNDDYVTMNNIQNMGQQFTLSIWAKTTGNSTTGGSSGKASTTGGGIFHESYNWGNPNSDGFFFIQEFNETYGGTGMYMEARIGNYSTFWNETTLGFDKGYPLNTWRFYTIVWNSPYLTTYLNGTLVGNTTFPYTLNTTWHNVQIGSSFYQYGFNGSIDEVMVFNRSLSATEISALYNSQSNKFNASFTNLTNGQHNYTVYAIDQYGNVNNSGLRNFNVTSGGASSNFSATWDTTKAGSNSTTIILPIYNGGSYNFTVWWGDGVVQNITDYHYNNHTYASSGIKYINISGTINGFQFNNAGDMLKIGNVSSWGNLQVGNNAGVFSGCSNMNYTGNDNLNLTGVTTLATMFSSASSFNGNISGWDTSKITTTRYMFDSASAFNSDISGWNTGNITDMTGMFFGATAFNQPIGLWDVHNVASMSGMFFSATAFNQNLSNWSTGKVTDMRTMFESATNFNGNISGWDTGNVTTMQAMFSSATHFNQSMANWNTGKVTNMNNMFDTATAFNGNISNWNTGQVTSMTQMFWAAGNFSQPIGSWNTSKVTDMGSMFYGVTLSTPNYDSLLQGWSSRIEKNNTVFDGGNSKYSNCSVNNGTAGRATLINSYAWTITDGGFNGTYVCPSGDTTPPTITFDISPTPANTSSTSSPVTISANISDASNTSSWIDFDKSLVGYWSMDYYNATGIFDNSSYLNNATFGAGTGLNYSNLTTGARGQALKFDGVNDYLNVSTPSLTNLTISAWVYITAFNGYGAIVARDNNVGVYTLIGPPNVISFYDETDCKTSGLALNQWYNVVALRNSTNRVLYINGVQNVTCAFGNASYPIKYIGNDNTNEAFNGSIDEVMIFNRSLSATEINALYDSKSNKFNTSSMTLANGQHNYTVYAIDASGNSANSGWRYFVVTSGGTGTCAYSSGNWNINCSESCAVSTNVNVGGNNISIIGVGTITVSANISNYRKLHIQGTDSINICKVRCINGGCFKH